MFCKNRNVISTYVPIYAKQQGKDQVADVFEVYLDVTTFVQTADEKLKLVSFIVLAVLAGLYLAQLVAVRRAQSILRVQEIALEDANRELGQRVNERTRELQACLQATDLLVRMGGDEFSCILDGIHTSAEVAQKAQDLLELFEQPFIVGANLLYLSARHRHQLGAPGRSRRGAIGSQCQCCHVPGQGAGAQPQPLLLTRDHNQRARPATPCGFIAQSDFSR